MTRRHGCSSCSGISEVVVRRRDKDLTGFVIPLFLYALAVIAWLLGMIVPPIAAFVESLVPEALRRFLGPFYPTFMLFFVAPLFVLLSLALLLLSLVLLLLLVGGLTRLIRRFVSLFQGGKPPAF